MSHLGIAKGLRESGGVEMAAAAITDTEILRRTGSTIDSSAGGGVPGTWTQLGKGPTSVANNTVVTVLAGISLAAGEVPFFYPTMKTAPTQALFEIFEPTDITPSANTVHFNWVKLSATGNIDFRLRHRDGSARDFDWLVLKDLPA